MSELLRHWASPLRVAISIHLVAVAVCTILARLDRTSIGYMFFDSPIRPAVVLLVNAAMLAIYVGPIVVLILVVQRGFSWLIAYAFLAEALLCLVQLAAWNTLSS